MDEEYKAFIERTREMFNKSFDEQSSILRTVYPVDAYNGYRALCFQYYLSGYFDALLGTENGQGRAAIEDMINGRTKPFSEIRKELKMKPDDEFVM